MARGSKRSSGPPKATYDPRLEEGLKAIRKGKTLGDAARSIRVSEARLRKYIQQTGVVAKVGRRWKVIDDNRERRVPVYSGGRLRKLRVPGYEQAAIAGRYWQAKGEFLDTMDTGHLAPFVGETVRDIRGREYPFETRPNTILRLERAHEESYEDIYRITD